MYNAKTSFNYWLQDIVQGISSDVNNEIFLFVEEHNNLKYPSLVVAYIGEAEWVQDLYMYQHVVEFNLFIDKKRTGMSDKIMQSLLKRMGFGRQTVSNFVKVPKKDYMPIDVADPVAVAGAAFIENMLLYRFDGIGFDRMQDLDAGVRHYQTEFALRFKLDF